MGPLGLFRTHLGPTGLFGPYEPLGFMYGPFEQTGHLANQVFVYPWISVQGKGPIGAQADRQGPKKPWTPNRRGRCQRRRSRPWVLTPAERAVLHGRAGEGQMKQQLERELLHWYILPWSGALETVDRRRRVPLP